MPMLFVVVAGCNGPTFEEIEDVGGLCILGDGDGSNTSYVENATVDAHVVLQACAPCGATDIMTSCSIERDGSTLTVSASASWWKEDVDVCTADCLVLETTCTSEPLPAGIYTVEYGDETTTLEVPSMGPAAQLGTIQLNEPQCG
jgi:hypothetical protein